MNPLPLHGFHLGLHARFTNVNGQKAVNDYGDPLAEHAALRETAGVLDLSFRSRLCLTGADRVTFLHGQVTNDVKALQTGEGCYAALISAKGRMQSDLNIYSLADELLLDFEPGLTQSVTQRLDNYIIAADVQIVDVAAHYGLLSVQGPRSAEVMGALGLFGVPPHPDPLPLGGGEGEDKGAAVAAPLLPVGRGEGRGKGPPGIPATPMSFTTLNDPTLGQLYLMNQPRTGPAGFDLFVPAHSLAAVADKLIAAAKQRGGRACGWQALEIARIEAGIPRYGADLDESNLPPEAGPGLEARAISYTKGCYIGQEVLARIRTYGQVAKALRGLRLADDLPALPSKGDKLFKDGKEVGFITSAIASPAFKANLALGYIRREANQAGNELTLRGASGQSTAKIVELPFR